MAQKALLNMNYSFDDRFFDYYETYSPYRGCVLINKDELHNIWEDKFAVLKWDTCKDHCFHLEYTFSYMFDGNKCGCLNSSGFKTQLVNRKNCSSACSGSFNQQCGGPIINTRLQSYYAIQVQVCNPGYYGVDCSFPCVCKWLYPCDVITGECGNGRVCAYLFEHYTSSSNAFRCDRERDSAGSFLQFIHDLIKRMKNFFTREYEIPDVCPDKHYGIYCLSECHCKFGTCDRISGVCSQKGCTIGWFGGRCDRGDVCIPNPCQNGGTCEKLLFQSYVCHCSPGYVGFRCHIVNPCIRDPCQNGGTCVALDEIFECKCPPLYSGSLCTIDSQDLEVTSDYLLCVRSGNPMLGESYDLPHSMETERSTSMTIQLCVRYCRIKDFKYAGLHNGGNCFCGNKYNKYGSLSIEDCNKPCSGNSSQQCGGPLAFSIHSTCPLGSYKLDCKMKCNCRGLMEQCDIKTGKCQDDLCAPGYTGEHCDKATNPPAIAISMVMNMYSVTLVFFSIMGLYVTIQLFFRNPESGRSTDLVSEED